MSEPLKGQLRQNGRLSKALGFCFVDAITVIERLIEDGTDVILTEGQSFRENKTTRLKNGEAIAWVNQRFATHSFEASYDGIDGLMHLSAVRI